MEYQQQIISLLKADDIRMRALKAVHSLQLPDGLIAAGFVRNVIWDHIYKLPVPTPLDDIDVIYYCPLDRSELRDKDIEQQLKTLEPNLPWSVKNQAHMHLKNGDRPYQNTVDAMSFWPEKQTAIGAKLDKYGKIKIEHCFDLSLSFNGEITHNPARSIEVFQKRIASKSWLKSWPQLKATTTECN